MAKFIYISTRGDALSLSDGENYYLTNIDSQTAAHASISSVVIGGTDGDTVNNVQAQPRTIILDLRIVADVEKTKRKILDVVKLKQRGRLVWEQDERTLEIQGIVEAIDMPRWSSAVLMQITLHCEQPFWENAEYIISKLREYVDLHYFTDQPADMLYFPADGIVLGEYDATRTQSYYNSGDVAVGLEIEIVALDTVTNPIIYDQNNNFFGCGYGTGNKQIVMQAGDTIKINTRKNEKSVTLNGVNILSKIKPSSSWLQLAAGENQFSINSDDTSISNMSFSLIYKQRYI